MHAPRGAALLISVIILTTVLLGFAAASWHGFLNDTSVLAATANKKSAEALAQACLETALAGLAHSNSYAGNTTISVGADTCTIRPITTGGGTWTIETEAVVNGYAGRLRVVLSSVNPVTISSWSDLSVF